MKLKANNLIKLAGNQRVKTMTVEVAYWSKANAIHNWFIQNLSCGEDDCQDICVDVDDLIKLRDTCKRVLDALEQGGMETKAIQNGWRYDPSSANNTGAIMEEMEVYKDTSVAIELLPPIEGFFFGSTEIGPWYVDDLKDTVKMIDDELSIDADYRKHWDYTYRASW